MLQILDIGALCGHYDRHRIKWLERRRGNRGSDILPKLLQGGQCPKCAGYMPEKVSARRTGGETIERGGGCFMGEKEKQKKTEDAHWLPTIRSTAGCLWQALRKAQHPSTGVCCPANPTLHISQLDKKENSCAGADVLSFPSRCCFLGCLTSRLSWAYFFAMSFPKAALVPRAS